MQGNSPQNTLDRVLATMEAEGAGSFVSLVLATPDIMGMLRNNQIKLIFAPIDSLVELLINRSRKQSALDQTVRDIVANHFCSSYSETDPVSISVNGNNISLDAQMATIIGPTKKILIGDLTIVPITKSLLITAAQIKQLYTQRSAGLKSAFGGGALGNAGLSVLINNGKIQGQDLLHLCQSNFEAKSFCDQKDANGLTIFHRLLRDEFGIINIPPTRNVRKLYSRYSRSAYTYVVRPDGDVLIGPHKCSKISENLHMQISEDYGNVYAVTASGKLEVFVVVASTNPAYDLKQIPVHGLPEDVVIKKLISASEILGRARYVLSEQGEVFRLVISYATRGDIHTTCTWLMLPPGILDISGTYALAMGQDGRPYVTSLESEFGRKPAPYYMPQRTIAIHSEIVLDVLTKNTTGECTLHVGPYVSPDSKHRQYDLHNFPGGSHACNFQSIRRHPKYETLYILTRTGELWYSKIIPNGNLGEWIKMVFPGGSKIVNLEFDKISYGEFPGVVDDQGRIFGINYVTMESFLIDTIPGIIEVPKISSEGQFNAHRTILRIKQ